MSDGATANVRLGHLVHVDCRHHAGRHSCALECILQRETVHGSCEHADIVRCGTIHPRRGCRRHPPEDVAAADHDSNLHAERRDGLDLFGDECDDCGVDAVLQLSEKRLPGELQQNSLIAQEQI
mgnify:CR=1 FL=1